jgi:chromosome segregation ATPase
MRVLIMLLAAMSASAAEPKVPDPKELDRLAEQLSQTMKQLEEKNALILKKETTNAELASSLAASTPGKKIEQYVAWCNDIRSTAAANEQKLQEHIAKLTALLVDQQSKLDSARQEIDRLTADLERVRKEQPK